jgi:hypothetical protein
MTGRRLVSLPFSDHCEPLVESSVTLTTLLNALKARAVQEGRYIELRPLTAPPVSEGLDPSADFCLHTMSLQPDLQSIFARFHRSHTQRTIRKATKLGVKVEAGRSEALLREFYSLHVLTRRRHGVPIQPFDWFRNLSECLGDRMNVLLARHDGRPVSAIVTAVHKRTLFYKYGASDAVYNRYGGMPLLFWEAVQIAKRQRLEEFDLGRSDRDDEGLMAFKDHLGATRTALTYYRCGARRASAQHGSWAPSFAKHAYALIPTRIQVSVGGVLYRHFA